MWSRFVRVCLSSPRSFKLSLSDTVATSRSSQRPRISWATPDYSRDKPGGGAQPGVFAGQAYERDAAPPPRRRRPIGSRARHAGEGGVGQESPPRTRVAYTKRGGAAAAAAPAQPRAARRRAAASMLRIRGKRQRAALTFICADASRCAAFNGDAHTHVRARGQPTASCSLYLYNTVGKRVMLH